MGRSFHFDDLCIVSPRFPQVLCLKSLRDAIPSNQVLWSLSFFYKFMRTIEPPFVRRSS